MELPKAVNFHLPDWVFEKCDLVTPRQSDVDRMDLAIELARRNVEHGGGPFGAVVFEADTGLVIAPGMNLVMPQSSSLLHCVRKSSKVCSKPSACDLVLASRSSVGSTAPSSTSARTLSGYADAYSAPIKVP